MSTFENTDGSWLALGATALLAGLSALPRGSADKDALRKKGAAIRSKIESIRAKMKEQERLLNKLEEHAKLLELGVDPDRIAKLKRGHIPKSTTIVVLDDASEVEVPIPISHFPKR